MNTGILCLRISIYYIKVRIQNCSRILASIACSPRSPNVCPYVYPYVYLYVHLYVTLATAILKLWPTLTTWSPWPTWSIKFTKSQPPSLWDLLRLQHCWYWSQHRRHNTQPGCCSWRRSNCCSIWSWTLSWSAEVEHQTESSVQDQCSRGCCEW